MTEQGRETEREAAVDAVHGATNALGAVRKELVRLNQYGRRNRHLIWLSIGSICLDVALTVALVLLYGAARNSQEEAQTARATAAAQHQSLLYACKLGNQSRAQQIQLWSHLASIASPPPHLTVRQLARNKREIRQLLAYIRNDFRPRNCPAIYRLPG